MSEMTNMEYNTQRPKMSIPEYGRNIKKMVDFAITIEDRDERNKIAQAIISVMGQLNPHLRDVDDFAHKLWDHLFILSKFKLDVDSPYPKPEKETFEQKPERIPYPDGKIRFGHYGKTIQLLIEAAKGIESSEEKNILKIQIANLMKKSYVMWNRENVENHIIAEHLMELSNGDLVLESPDQITFTENSVKTPKKKTNPKNNHNNKQRRPHSNKRRRK